MAQTSISITHHLMNDSLNLESDSSPMKYFILLLTTVSLTIPASAQRPLIFDLPFLIRGSKSPYSRPASALNTNRTYDRSSQSLPLSSKGAAVIRA